MRIPSVITRWQRVSVGVLLAGCLVVGGARPAAASVVYDFSLASNGDVGAISIELTFDAFLPVGEFRVLDLSEPEVTAFSSGNAIDPASSTIAIEVTAAQTFVGFFLLTSIGDIVLQTAELAHFFAFGRSPGQAGTVLSSAGQVTSESASLATVTPTATLVVTSAVPEPATVALLGLGAFGAVTRRRRRSTDA